MLFLLSEQFEDFDLVENLNYFINSSIQIEITLKPLLIQIIMHFTLIKKLRYKL